MKLAFTAAMAVLLAAASGCGEEETRTMTIDAPASKAKPPVGGAPVKRAPAPDAQQKTPLEKAGTVNAAAFEGLLYPGAQAEGGASGEATGDANTSTASFWSADPAEKLVEHYKKLFPSATATSYGAMTTLAGKTAAGAAFSISIAAGEGTDKTRLTILVVRKS
jgi:hypothetical protein